MKRTLFMTVVLLCFATIYAQSDKQLAKVDNYSGVRVFSYCEPVAEYEVLGEVSFAGSSGGYYTIGGMTFASGTEQQYNEIRNALIMSAVMANRAVEGVIIHPIKNKQGRATMIKFKEDAENKDLAYVTKKRDYYIFIDCKPTGDYEFQGKRRCSDLVDGSSDSIIDGILRNTKNLSRNANAVIVTFVTNGYDYAEAITLK